ncbi:MAG: DUF6106 family protein [Clostridiaceae bacterium]|nr:DUF6106 family protein [Clostridiaceae bacterium]MDY3285992.1 DUF6106 family protein [Eubacteriales bacterium]
MGDTFLEYIVKKAPETKTSLLKVAIILGTVFVCYFGMVFIMSSETLAQFGSIFLLLICGIVYGAYRLFTSFNLEFEYIVTNGELDVDKIIARRSRKRLCSLRPVEVEIMAPYNDEYKNQYDRGEFALTVDASSSKYAKSRWFILADTKKYGRVRLLWEPTDKMIENMRTYMPRKVMKA